LPLDSAAKTTGLMRVLGTNPEHMFQRLFDDQLQRIKKTNNPAAVADLNGQFRMLKQQLDEVMGLPISQGTQPWQKWAPVFEQLRE
jgi:hypothetical protein